MTFKELNIGDRFEFDHSDFPHWSGATGPWVKVSARRYVTWAAQAESKKALRVGTVNTTVIRLFPR